LPKKRLIFVLLYRGGQFCISRNFRLQTVGSAAWLARNYGFAKVSRFIDELVILNAESEPADQTAFLNTAASIAAEVFVPVALGGAIRGLSDAEVYFRHGADKVVVNTLLWKDPGAVKDIADVYGVQAVMASVDYRGLKAPRTPHFRGEGAPEGMDLAAWLRRIAALGVGEILLNSVDRDGTGMGLDTAVMEALPAEVQVPVVLTGGIGRNDHFRPGLELSQVSGVATSNLFAFMGEGLSSARTKLMEAGLDMAAWV
jgi:cyclase